MNAHQSLEDIFRVSAAIPFTENELRMAMDGVKTRRKKGADLSMGHSRIAETPEDIVSAAQDGFILMHSTYQLDSGFMFVKLNAGKSLLGRQKAVYASYLEGPLGCNVWSAGPVFKSWPIAVTSIGNVYRGNGFR